MNKKKDYLILIGLVLALAPFIGYLTLGVFGVVLFLVCNVGMCVFAFKTLWEKHERQNNKESR